MNNFHQFRLRVIIMFCFNLEYCTPCKLFPGKQTKTYDIEEERAVPIPIVDLTRDFCEKMHLSPLIPESVGKFVLSPSTQFLYDYFEIRDIKVKTNDGPNLLFSERQFLILSKTIDLEELCGTELYHDDKQPDFPNVKHYNSRQADKCDCRVLLGWCRVNLFLALTHMNNNNHNLTKQGGIQDEYTFFTIHLKIFDINDNDPVFFPPVYNLSISEGEPVGAKFRLPSADDRDMGLNGRVNYRISYVLATAFETSSEERLDKVPFQLETDNLRGLFLRIAVSLDRELYLQYEVHVTATDSGISVSRSGELCVHIVISDVNDMEPRFRQPSYLFNVSESAKPHSVIGVITADDFDETDNGRVSYSLRNKSYQNRSMAQFTIDMWTGELRVLQSLDRELESSYDFIVFAIDHGEPRRSSSVNLRINILDENDNSPIVFVVGLKVLRHSDGLQPDLSAHEPLKLLLSSDKQSAISVNIFEDLAPFSVISFIATQDTDEGTNGTVSCSLNGTMFSLKTSSFSHRDHVSYLPPQSVIYKLISVTNLDRETCSSYVIHITCTDDGFPTPRNTKISLTINIKDVNDNAPQIQALKVHSPAEQHSTSALTRSFSDLLTIQIPENLSVNSTFAQVFATDADFGKNGEIEFTLLQVGQRDFYVVDNTTSRQLGFYDTFLTVDRTSGRLYIREPLLRIPTENCNYFVLLASDKGIPALSTIMKFCILISVVNLRTPKITLQNLNYQIELERLILFIEENQPPGSLIGRVLAKDDDRGEAGTVHYWITHTWKQICREAIITDQEFFLLDNQTGMLAINRMIDRELDGEEFIMTIHAEDLGSPRFESQTNITVRILDINDNQPYFIDPVLLCQEKLDPDSSCIKLQPPMEKPFEHKFILEQNELGLLFAMNQSIGHIPLVSFPIVDLDAKDYLSVKYQLKPNCDSSLDGKLSWARMFHIDPVRGCLYLNYTVKAVDNHTLGFYVVASEHGASELTHSATLDITMNFQQLNDGRIQLYFLAHVAVHPCDIMFSNQESPSLSGFESRIPMSLVMFLLGAVLSTLLIVFLGFTMHRTAHHFKVKKMRNTPMEADPDWLQCHQVHNQLNENPLLQKDVNECLVGYRNLGPDNSQSCRFAHTFPFSPSENAVDEQHPHLTEEFELCKAQNVPVVVYFEKIDDVSSVVL